MIESKQTDRRNVTQLDFVIQAMNEQGQEGHLFFMSQLLEMLSLILIMKRTLKFVTITTKN